ncbi:MAG TPA: Imm50 family immunity protein [Bryobacteraceae bacterium]|nr:Imm50 family immunity protein [Bryobacteraceae bacterium]
MTTEGKFSDVPGAAELFVRFGSWPSFQDAEVRSVHLNREGPSRIRVATKQVVVTFVLGGVTELSLNGFNGRNALSSLTLTKDSNGYTLELWPGHGISGAVTARSVRVEFVPVE